MSFDAVVENAGFAAPDRAYAVHLVKPQANGDICAAAVPMPQHAGINTWQGGGRLHALARCVYTGLPADDTEDLYLALSDTHGTLRHRPEYRIMFQRGAPWDGTRGVHSLATDVVNVTTQSLFDAPPCTVAFVCTPSGASDFGHVLPVYEIPASLRPSPQHPAIAVEGNYIANPSFEMWVHRQMGCIVAWVVLH